MYLQPKFNKWEVSPIAVGQTATKVQMALTMSGEP